MRVVIDTNVIISSLVVPTGTPGRLMHTVRQQPDVEPVVSSALFAEYARAASYPKVQARTQFSPQEIAKLIEALRPVSLVVDQLPDVYAVEDDPEDNLIVATAIAGEAEYIVSGDRHLLQLQSVGQIRIVSPAAFLLLISE